MGKKKEAHVLENWIDGRGVGGARGTMVVVRGVGSADATDTYTLSFVESGIDNTKYVLIQNTI